MPTSFQAPAAVIFGAGSRHLLVQQLRLLQASQILIVSDDYLRRSGVLEDFLRELEKERIITTVFSGVPT